MKKGNTTIVYDQHDVFEVKRLISELTDWDAPYISVENLIKAIDSANIRNMV